MQKSVSLFDLVFTYFIKCEFGTLFPQIFDRVFKLSFDSCLPCLVNDQIRDFVWHIFDIVFFMLTAFETYFFFFFFFFNCLSVYCRLYAVVVFVILPEYITRLVWYCKLWSWLRIGIIIIFTHFAWCTCYFTLYLI